jgi:hypothetical protein
MAEHLFAGIPLDASSCTYIIAEHQPMDRHPQMA